MTGRFRRAAALFTIGALAACGGGEPQVLPAPPERLDARYRLSSWSREAVPAPPERLDALLDLGERLYGWNCFPCHGADGRGDGPNAVRQGLHPRDFTRGLFKLKTSAPGEMPFDTDLYRTIAVGVPLGGMPRNPDLEPRDRWALVAYVKSLSVRQTPDGVRESHFASKPAATPWKSPAPGAVPDAARGRELFLRGVQCAICHGPRGKGDGPAAPGLRDAWERPAPLPDLTRGEIGLKSGSDLQDIFRTVTLGMAGTPMPSFAALPERDRWDLAAFVRSLFEPVSTGERIYLAAGCTACHTIGRGKHVGPDLVDVRNRRTRAWLRTWLADPPGTLAHDPATRKEFSDYTIQMPNLNLDDAAIDGLIEFFETLSPPARGK